MWASLEIALRWLLQVLLRCDSIVVADVHAGAHCSSTRYTPSPLALAASGGHGMRARFNLQPPKQVTQGRITCTRRKSGACRGGAAWGTSGQLHQARRTRAFRCALQTLVGSRAGQTRKAAGRASGSRTLHAAQAPLAPSSQQHAGSTESLRPLHQEGCCRHRAPVMDAPLTQLAHLNCMS